MGGGVGGGGEMLGAHGLVGRASRGYLFALPTCYTLQLGPSKQSVSSHPAEPLALHGLKESRSQASLLRPDIKNDTLSA